MAFLLPPTTSYAQVPSTADYTRSPQARNNPHYVIYTPNSRNGGSLPPSPIFYNGHQRNLSLADPISARSTPGIPMSPSQNLLLQVSPFQAASRHVLPNYFLSPANMPNSKPPSRLSISQLQNSNQMTNLDFQSPHLDKFELGGINTERNPYAASLFRQKHSHTRSQNDLTAHGTLQLLSNNDVREADNLMNIGKSLNNLGMKKGEENIAASKQYMHLANVLNSPLEGSQAKIKLKNRSARPSISRYMEEPENAKELELPKPSKYLHSTKFLESKASINELHEKPIEHSRHKVVSINMGENHFGFNSRDAPSMKALPIYKYDAMFNVRPRRKKSIKLPQEIEILEGRISAPIYPNDSSEESNPKSNIHHAFNTPKTERKPAKFNVAVGEYIRDSRPKEAKHMIATSHGNRERKMKKDHANDSEEVFELKNPNVKPKENKSHIKLPPVGNHKLPPLREDVKAEKEPRPRRARKNKENTNTEMFENELSEVILFGFPDESEEHNSKNLNDILADLEALDTIPS